MRIKDITVEEIRQGKNWRLRQDADVDAPMEEWAVEPLNDPNGSDTVVYSGLLVSADGSVVPIVMVKELETCEWWGDTCEHINGVWQQLGLRPNPQVVPCEGYIASPLDCDPSFKGEYRHEVQRREFQRWVGQLTER